MGIRIVWQPNNGGKASHEVYVRSTPMTWPDDMPPKLATLPPGVDQYLADVPATEDQYVIVAARRGEEVAPSEQWYFAGIPAEAAAGLGAWVQNEDGDLVNDFERLKSDLIFEVMIIGVTRVDLPDEPLDTDLIFDVKVNSITDNPVTDVLASGLIFDVEIGTP